MNLKELKNELSVEKHTETELLKCDLRAARAMQRKNLLEFITEPNSRGTFLVRLTPLGIREI